MTTKRCNECGELKDVSAFRTVKKRGKKGQVWVYPYAYCRPCTVAQQMRVPKDVRAARQKDSVARKYGSYAERSRLRREGLREKGLTSRYTVRKPRHVSEHSLHRARLAKCIRKLRWYLASAQDGFVAAYYAATGKPWNNPRLSDTEALRIRYAMDPSFHRKELARVKARKRARRKQEAELRLDLTTAMEVAIREAAEHCAYCHVLLTPETRTLDHIVPLSRGGKHAIDNVVAACRSCNGSKQDAMLPEWRARQ